MPLAGYQDARSLCAERGLYKGMRDEKRIKGSAGLFDDAGLKVALIAQVVVGFQIRLVDCLVRVDGWQSPSIL